MFRYIFFLLQISSFLFAQNYLWPTDASKHITSSFCEYRPGHYHSALDIKTWNKEGYKCFAIEDGYIERIKISPHGAGKALYIKLNDGRKAVYFHLQRYSDKLEAKIREIQLAQKSYSIEWWPKNWKVKKGDFIAYTGQTGIGVPHLHFEIRDQSNRPLNPLQFYNIVKDDIRPQLKRLLVIPQDRTSRVNGSFLPAQYDLTYIHDGVYIIREPVHVKGLVGLALNGYDMANGVSNKFAWYTVKMTVNGEKIFEYAYDRVSFSQSRYVDVDIYYPEKKTSGRSYNKLYLEPFNILDFYNRDLGNGLIRVNNNRIAFEIEAKDYSGNKSIIKGTLLPEGDEGPPALKKSDKQETTFISLKIPDGLKDIILSSGVSKMSLQPIEYFEIVERQEKNGEITALLKAHLASAGDNIIEAVVENNLGQKDTTWLPVKPMLNRVTTDIKLMGKNLCFLFENLADVPDIKLFVVQKNDTTKYPLEDISNITECIIPARDIYEDTFKVLLKDNYHTYVDTNVTTYKMIPGQTRNYALFSDSIQIQAGKVNAFDTLLFNIEMFDIDKNQYDIPVLSNAFSVNSGNHILNSRVNLSVLIDPVFFNPDQVAIYSVDDDELDYEGGSYDPQSGYVTDRTRSFSTFVVAADTVPPVLELINFRENGSYENVSTLRFKVTDDVSGIGTDKNIEIYLDDQYLIPEWDPEVDIVKSIVHFKPQPGPHTVTISCKDRAGNVTEKTIPINIL